MSAAPPRHHRTAGAGAEGPPGRPGSGSTGPGMRANEAQAREALVRLGGALHARRIFGENHAHWPRTLDAVEAALKNVQAAAGGGELALGVVEKGLALAGVMLDDQDAQVARLSRALQQRDVEILSFRAGLLRSDVEGALAFLGTDPADVAGESGTPWLRARGIDGVSIRHLKIAAGSRGLGFRDVFRGGLNTVGAAFGAAAKAGAIDLLSLRELSGALVSMLGSASLPLHTLFSLKEHDDHSLAHSITVSVLASAQATSLDLPAEQIEQVALCGLLHDIGKSRIPEAVLKKRGALDPRERALLATHAGLGARLLMATPGAGQAAPLVALEHHGAPVGQRPHLYSQLVAIADLYDVLRSLRPFDARTSNPGIFAMLGQRLRDRVHPALLGRFGRLLGVLPDGAMVRLQTGEVCRIVRAGVEDPLRPLVEIVDTAIGALPAGATHDLAGGPTRVDLRPHAALQSVTDEEIEDYG